MSRPRGALFTTDIILTVATCLAQEHAPLDRLSAMDVFAAQYAADPQISPDASKIVCVRQFTPRRQGEPLKMVTTLNRELLTQKKPGEVEEF